MSENGETETREAVTVKGIDNILFPCPNCGNRNTLIKMKAEERIYFIACDLCEKLSKMHFNDPIGGA